MRGWQRAGRDNAADDFSPVAWVGRYPLYVATLLVGVHVVAMLAGAVALAAGAGGWLVPLAFDSAAFVRGALWQAATYPFVHVPLAGYYYLWFAVEMAMLLAFGREVERYLGRRAFGALYALLVVAPVPLFVLFGVGGRFSFSDSGQIHFAVFVAFAALYPNAELVFGIRAKLLAVVLIAAASLQSLVVQNWAALAISWGSALFAWGYVARLKGWQWLRLPQVRIGGRGRRDAAANGPVAADGEPSAESSVASIDPLLDKISRNGLKSLSPAERAQLERARNALLKKR